MRATSIPDHEARFFRRGTDTQGKKFILSQKSIGIKNSSERMSYVKCRRHNNDDTYYFREKPEKTQIVLHFTAGYLRGDVAALTHPSVRVSTPFLIARNGTILNLWSSAYWSYHLGRGAIGGNTSGSKRSIGIELSNIGYLKEIGNNLVTSYSDDDVYCSLDQTAYYQKIDMAFRGQQYYATYTSKQYDSLGVLLRYLTAQYDIPRELLPPDTRFLIGTDQDLPQFRGITSHVNYRPNGKWDIGPAFDWERVERSLD